MPDEIENPPPIVILELSSEFALAVIFPPGKDNILSF